VKGKKKRISSAIYSSILGTDLLLLQGVGFSQTVQNNYAFNGQTFPRSFLWKSFHDIDQLLTKLWNDVPLMALLSAFSQKLKVVHPRSMFLGNYLKD